MLYGCVSILQDPRKQRHIQHKNKNLHEHTQDYVCNVHIQFFVRLKTNVPKLAPYRHSCKHLYQYICTNFSFFHETDLSFCWGNSSWHAFSLFTSRHRHLIFNLNSSAFLRVERQTSTSLDFILTSGQTVHINSPSTHNFCGCMASTVVAGDIFATTCQTAQTMHA